MSSAVHSKKKKILNKFSFLSDVFEVWNHVRANLFVPVEIKLLKAAKLYSAVLVLLAQTQVRVKS